MKKRMTVFLAALMLLSLLGCSEKEQPQNAVVFYYRAADISYDAQATLLQGESRDGSSFNTPQEALSAYLAGPLTDQLYNPFPVGLSLISMHMEADVLYLTLSDQLGSLTGLELTIACCCIAKTCIGLTDAKDICISAETALLGGERSIILNENDILLLDDIQ